MSEGTPELPSAAEDSIPGDLGWNLGMVLRGYQKRFEVAVEQMPAGIRGFQVLSVVVHKDPPNQQAIGAHLAIDRTVLTYLIDSLVDAGVVERVPDPRDRRARRIVATEKGRTMLSDNEQRVAAAEADLLAGLNDTESAALASLVGRLAMDVHRSQPGSSPCDAMDYLP